ncbi:MAG: hypothetical protein ACYC1D_05355 [Acidimicrobiales bacterium]
MSANELPLGDPIGQFVVDFADGLVAADSRRPRAEGRSVSYKPGIGPFSESAAVKLVMAELACRWPDRYSDYGLGVAYPELSRQRCDVCLGSADEWTLAVEVKLLRLLGDNGKLNDNMLMHILSPYPQHRSALTDCAKLVGSSLGARKMVLIYAFDAEGYPTELAVDAFERLAARVVRLSPRQEAPFAGLVHPVHTSGRVLGWELLGGSS